MNYCFARSIIIIITKKWPVRLQKHRYNQNPSGDNKPNCIWGNNVPLAAREELTHSGTYLVETHGKLGDLQRLQTIKPSLRQVAPKASNIQYITIRIFLLVFRTQ
jgi:hypothetical protein